jgi:putative acetyltransferase
MTRIVEGNLDDPTVLQLLNVHVMRARAETGRDSAHALDADTLKTPDIRFWSVWVEERVVGIGALKRLSHEDGEVKSMHTSEKARGGGIGSLLLRHIVETAREMGMTRLSLETGAWDYFAPARAFYRQRGFEDCAPFGAYKDDPNSMVFDADPKQIQRRRPIAACGIILACAAFWARPPRSRGWRDANCRDRRRRHRWLREIPGSTHRYLPQRVRFHREE